MPYKSKDQAKAVLIKEKQRGRTESHAAQAAKSQLRKSTPKGRKK